MTMQIGNPCSVPAEADSGERLRRLKRAGGVGCRPEDIRRWLEQQPSLDELSKVFPAEWREAQRDVAQVFVHEDRDAAADAIARRLVLPPERGGAVYTFQRNTTAH